ncbi:MAG: ATP-dependent RecD-like DNA helicase [Oscillospiraceae bacterium]|nr:ATP-dependent RecD-like DNA helicase [Oscillospiraceae bacterium]
MTEHTLHIEGTVENVLFRNEQNGYAVLDLNAGGELITVVGEIGDADEGEQLILEGSYVNHPRFGTQFQVQYCERKLPADALNIQKYLSSGAIKGIGPSLARKIVDVFGAKTLEVMENEPTRLLEIRGISPKKCENIAAEVKEIFALRSIMTFLSQYGIRSKYAMRVYQKFGSGGRDMICANPYLLCKSGIDLEFRRVEKLAHDMKIALNSPNRVAAGIEFILAHNTKNGYTCLPLEKLEPKAAEYLGISQKVFYEVYQQELQEGNIVEYLKGENEYVYLPEYYHAERYIADRIRVLRDFSTRDELTKYEKMIDEEQLRHRITYEKLQREAIATALSRSIMIMTGGPGTGKTTTLNAIISLYEKQGCKVMIAAPTGRAAQRISDLTGYHAKTIHRLLEVEFDMTGEPRFKHNEKNPLICDVLVVDEMSMVDVLLFEGLLRALRLGCKVILVGDSDQLPSVGAGNLLGDLIDSGIVPVIALKQIFRQAQESCIITNAHKIINGEYPDLARKDADFFFFQRLEPNKAKELVVELVKERLPNAYGFSPTENIQVITPSRKGILGVTELNKILQQVLNPPKHGVSETKSMLYTFREGDKVMQMKNNYDIVWHKDGEEGTGIFNGDIGRIISINRHSGEAVIEFDMRRVVYPFDMLEQLELAYAITVHKSQGSEFDAVILPILGGFPKLYYRNLLYTAVTRAKKMLIAVGSRNKIHDMVDNNRRTKRYTCLKHMLTARDENEQDTENLSLLH